MGDDLGLPERNCARTPMQWSTEPHAGFTKSEQARACLSSATGPTATSTSMPPSSAAIPNSMLNWTERIIRMRKEVPEVGWGDFKVIPTRDPRRAGDALRLAQQLGRCSCTISMRSRAKCRFAVGLAGNDGKLLVNLLSEDHSHADEATAIPLLHRRLRLSLVSGRRPRLSAQAQRYRHQNSVQRRSSDMKVTLQDERLHSRAGRGRPGRPRRAGRGSR